MEAFRGFGFSSISNNIKRKRSSTSRRPRTDSQPFPDISSLSSTPPSSDENTGFGTHSWKKELNLNQCSSRASFSSFCEAEIARKITKTVDGGYVESNEAGAGGSSRDVRCSEGVLAPANWKSVNQISGRTNCTSNSAQPASVSDGQGNENKLKKVKLKVGGVTRTIHAQATPDGVDGNSVGGSSTNLSNISDAPRPRRKLILQANIGDSGSPPLNSDRSVPQWKDSSKSNFTSVKSDFLIGNTSEENDLIKQGEKYESTRKSKRVPKRRILDGAFDDGNDDEIRYLEKLKAAKVSVKYGAEYEDDEEESGKKQRKISKVLKRSLVGDYNVEGKDQGSVADREGKKSRHLKAFEDADYLDDEDPMSDDDLEIKRKKSRKEFVDSMGDLKTEMAVTTRRRALQTGKDVSSSLSASLVEFPNGLPLASSRKQNKLSEVEQQLKKAEAAQRRRLQSEKAARESEAEAIRKILGQDSSRKKKEEKVKKRQEELAQERAANAMKLPSNSVRWIMGPSGTVVTFPDEMGLPSIFDSKPCSYPAPREKCAGPSCMNPYKYRDSKSKLPLCSLQCYKAINGKMQPLSAC